MLDDVETETNVLKWSSRQAFSKDISELSRSRHMENANLTESHLLSNKMNVNLNMLGAPVLNRIP